MRNFGRDFLLRYGGIEAGADDPDVAGNLERYLRHHVPAAQRASTDVDTCLVQETAKGPLREIRYISPAKVRPTDTKNVGKFESPHCSEDEGDRRSFLT